MDEILSRGHAELAPPIKEDEEVWYLPIFGVYHPQKKDQIRAVFDSSAEIDGISLNKVHVFGNTTSPAVATYGLQKTASESETTYGLDVREFVERNFYVDDALTSLATPVEVISLLQRTQDALRIGVTQEEKPYTRRGVLSRVNSLYDPLGFIAPTTIQGRLLLRKVVSATDDWDDPLPPDLRDEWEQWVESLQELNNLTVPRSYGPISIYNASSKDVHIFSDASEKAIGAVAYIRTLDEQGNAHLGFVLGKSKLAPSHGHTIPRLELCGAVLAVEIAKSIAEHLDMPLSNFHFYSDSRVVLGYISNENRRFYTYVANRVERIRQVTDPPQWFFVSTEHNPATRTLAPSELSSSMWLSGPSFWLRDKDTKESQETLYNLENPDLDKEVRPEVKTYKTEIKTFDWTHRFEKFSTWNNLVVAIARLQKFAKSISKTAFAGSSASSPLSVQDKERAQMFILQHVQRDAYHKDMQCLKERKSLPKDSSVSSLDPTLSTEC
ncbi:uncharacterized protein LOC110443943 [Mizuhopecten yessoensis]|uniref:uncharacterized protein LOC110443943 n=1 Tax=Mizuhopecten yessoensis TaxID=6573 RepID=UPI000B459D17|nr:uncharacterized protein LOC110443943 [Mizuhopecten yessoensis]